MSPLSHTKFTLSENNKSVYFAIVDMALVYLTDNKIAFLDLKIRVSKIGMILLDRIVLSKEICCVILDSFDYVPELIQLLRVTKMVDVICISENIQLIKILKGFNIDRLYFYKYPIDFGLIINNYSKQFYDVYE